VRQSRVLRDMGQCVMVVVTVLANISSVNNYNKLQLIQLNILIVST